MDIVTEIAKIKELVGSAKEVVVATHEKPTEDSVGATCALYLGLVSLGKKVTVVCPDPMIVGFSSFVGVNKITQDLGKRNFIISLDYAEGSIEKVSYNIEGDKFNLVVEPRPGFEPFSQDKAHYSYAGTACDLIITVDTIHLGGLKKLYEENKELFAGKPILNIDRHPNNAGYGQINFVDNRASSAAELVAQVLSGIGVQLTQDIATNLLNALYGGTDNFQNPGVTATAFQLGAACVRAGGKRFQKTMPQQDDTPVTDVATAQPVSEATSVPIAPTSPTAPNEVKPMAPKPTEVQTTAPADWLKPKIFKSSTPVS